MRSNKGKNKKNPTQTVFCVIPAFNEEKTIKKVIEGVSGIVQQVVVVDDGSGDNTSAIARKCGAKVLGHIINRGQGAALQTGNEYAIKNNADIIVHFDADGQFLAEDIRNVIKPLLSDEYDIVFGSRFLRDNSELPYFKKYFIYPLARVVNRLLVGSRLSDPQNGFRAMTKKTAKKIKIKNDGMAHNSEIQYKAFSLKLRIKEVAVTVRYNDFGQGIFSGKGRSAGGVRIVIDLLLSKIMN